MDAIWKMKYIVLQSVAFLLIERKTKYNQIAKCGGLV